MKDPSHPIWAIVRIAVVLAGITILLWMNASHFDETEHSTILWMIPVLVGSEGIGQLIKVFKK